MSASGAQPPAPPDNVRPGQLGVVLLRRVIIGDIAATLVDLSVRQLLRLEEPQDEPGSWLIRPVHANAPRHRRESMLRYEQTLLDGLSREGPAASLASLAPEMPAVLDKTRAEMLHDAVRRGWLRHLHHDERTEAGERLADRIRSFQRGLRQLATEQGEGALAGPLLPYALHFAMIRDTSHPLVGFAHDWVSAFAALPGWHQPAPEPYNALDDPVPMDNDGPNWPKYMPT
jgi:hypothetical protein